MSTIEERKQRESALRERVSACHDGVRYAVQIEALGPTLEIAIHQIEYGLDLLKQKHFRGHVEGLDGTYSADFAGAGYGSVDAIRRKFEAAHNRLPQTVEGKSSKDAPRNAKTGP